jgi:KDO2-lipid IV(A) lauroyltransferase
MAAPPASSPESYWQSITRALLKAVGELPLPFLHGVGVLLGLLLILLPNRLKRISWAHMRYCLPALSRGAQRRLVWASLIHSAVATLEAPAIWFGPQRRLRRWLDVPDVAAQLAALRAQGRGVILLCPHWGAWELAGMFCSAEGPMTSVYKPQKSVMDALILEGRTRLGARLVPTTASGVKQVLLALRQNEMVGILPDHDPPEGSGVFAPLFGHPAHTMDLVTKLAGKTGAPVWFCLAQRRLFRGFTLQLLPAPLSVADPAEGAAALNQGVEAVIARAPSQYWWGYERYRRRPAGAPGPY